MKIKHSRIISFILIIFMLFSLSMTSCKSKKKAESTGDNNTANNENDEPKLPDNEPTNTSEKKKIAFAEMIDFQRIQFTLAKDNSNSPFIIDTLNCTVFDGERAVTVSNITTNTDSLTGIIEVGENLDITKRYSLVIDGYKEKTVIPTFVFDTEEFIENYTYQGEDLGAVLNGDKTTFKVWAPTASNVVLNLFANSTDSAYLSVNMAKGDAGVWSYTADCGHGTYYTYSVTTQIGTNDATDPYAKATNLDGNRGMVVDLATTDPDGWSTDFQTEINSYSDAIIWGVDPREFSTSSNFSFSGYLAFTERGLTNEHGESIGVDYLINLGVTHVNLLSVYGFKSHADGNSQEIYGTANYNSPNNSLSSNPYSPDVAIKEYKEMVKSLHEAGIGVIVSVDYAHTDNANTSFDKIVPYYYYRYTDGGVATSSSGCGKDTASERCMFSKFITDSIEYLAEEYDLDGFSFETIHLCNIDTIDKIEKTIHSINHEAVIIGKHHGTTDSSIISSIKEISALSPTDNAIGGIATFSDAIHDGLTQAIFGEYTNSYAEAFASISASIKGIITGANGEIKSSAIVNHIGFNGNEALSNPTNLSNDEKLSLLRLAFTHLLVSKGTVYIDAGEEFLSSTSSIDWSLLNSESAEYNTTLYIKELIRIRKDYHIFGDAKAEINAEMLKQAKSTFFMSNTSGDKAIIISNPTSQDLTYTLDGSWHMIANGTTAIADGIEICEGRITIPSYTAIILINNILLDN